MALLSPGVEIIEIDASAIVPTVSNSTAVFAGNFSKGAVDSYNLITNKNDLVSFYGTPTNLNYNDFFQAFNFLSYGNSLLVARAANTNGSSTQLSGITVTANEIIGATTIAITGTTSGVKVGDYVNFGDINGTLTEGYYVTGVTVDTDITLDHGLETAITIADDPNIYLWEQTKNGVFEAVSSVAVAEAVTSNFEYNNFNLVIQNDNEFETLQNSIAFTNATDSKIKIITRNPGSWGNSLKIAIATPSAFGLTVPTLAFDGIALDELFEYAPSGTEVGLMVMLNNEIVETFTVDFDPTAKDSSNKSTYIEDVIYNNSSYIFVKDNTAVTDPIKDYVFSLGGASTSTLGTVISPVLGRDSAMGNDDLLNAYNLFNNPEALDIDIVIANEADDGVSAKNLAETRKDCIAFIGAKYSDVVGKKASIATKNLVDWRKTGTANFNSMFVVACGNYMYQYDKFNDKNRWVNVSGSISGLRAQTSTNRASWWASAGLERGQLKNVIKLAFSPDNGMRDLLYKNGINPIVSFPGLGTVMWGFEKWLHVKNLSNCWNLLRAS